MPLAPDATCPICHRSKLVVSALCDDCAKGFDIAAQGCLSSPALTVSKWAAAVAWQFAGAEIAAAEGSSQRVDAPRSNSDFARRRGKRR